MTEHTKGPWMVERSHGLTEIRSADNESLMCDEVYDPWVPENEKDWDLIAAAPELLEALKSILAVVAGECPSIIESDHNFEAAHAAIAKAKGEAK